MKRQLLVRKGAFILSMISLLSVILFTYCAKDNPIAPVQKEPSYSFSGTIIDGYTGKAISGAVVSYFDTKGDTLTTFKTGPDGGFNITEIPYGNSSFRFSYTPPATGTLQYTTAAVTIEGNDWENFAYKGLSAGVTTTADTLVGGIRSVAGPVKLYPLSGSVSGTVLAQLHDRSPLTTVKSAVVKVTFDPAANLSGQGNNDAVIGSNIEVGPSTFEVLTDSVGKFMISGIPVSGDSGENVTIKIVSVTSEGIDWAMGGAFASGLNVELAAGQTVPVGAIIMNPIAKIALFDLENNFKTGVLTPEQNFVITYSDSLDSVSYAVLSYTDNVDVKRNVPVTVTVAGQKITIDPHYSLINETAYTLNVYVYGKKGQSSTNEFNVTVAGGGLADVVSSNVLTSSKGPVYNFGVKTPVTFTFVDSITSNPSVQVTGAGNDIVTSTSGKTLTITPRSTWKNGIINISLVLANGSAVRISTALNVENSLSFVTSNIFDFNSMTAKSGLTLNTPIMFVANKSLTNANVILTEAGVSLPTTVTISTDKADQVQIVPINVLKPAVAYTLTITVENSLGESKSQTVTFTTSAAQFYPVFDNVRIGNDKAMPRLDFAPNANIVIKMSKKVFKATASLTPAVNVKTTISGDSIVIDPEEILTEGTAYTLSVNAQDSNGTTISGQYVVGFVPRALVMIMASNVITANNVAITNAEKSITPWFKLSSAPVASKMKVVITNPSVDAIVTVRGDTLFVDPASDFKYDNVVTVAVTGEAVDGNYISFTKSFTVMRKPQMTLVASNVLNSNFEGLTNVAEDIEMWYKLSRLPSAATVTATIGADNAVVRVNGDTIFVKHTRNFTAGATPVVTIRGLDIEGIGFELAGDNTAWPDWSSFTVRQALFPVASNTWDVADLVADNFTVYGAMWVKWSQPLSTDLTKISWSAVAGAKTLTGYASAGESPNATIRVSGDTLFVTPIKERITLGYNDMVGFQVSVTGDKGQISNATVFKVNNAESNLYVSATNTVNALNHEMIDTMGLTQTVYLVSSQPITEVTAINNLQNIAAANLEIKRTLRISGDTIFFTPFEKLARETQYRVSFDVKLANGLTGTNDELQMTWKTVKATNLYVKATNTQSNGVMVDAFDPLQTVYIVPSAPIDSIDAIAAFDDGNGPAENTPDDNGAGVNLLKQRLRLSAAGDTLFWTPVDTLKFGTRYGIKFNVTLKTGEQFGGSEMTAIWKTKPGVALVSTNDMAAGSVHYRMFKCKGDSLVATFSKAIDTSKAFSVANFGAVGKLIYAWSADLKTVTIKDTSKLTVKTYAAIQDYSTSGNPQYSAITFSLTSLDGEQKVVTANADYAGVRPNLAIHTEDELVVVDASYLKVHNANKVAAADLAIDTVDSAANITITFNRAIDAAKVNVAARDAYFALVNVASPTTMLDYAISFSNGGKTVVINPAINMTAGATYNVKVKSVPDLTSGDDFSGVAASFVTTDGFKVKPMPRTLSVAALQSYIKADTNSVTGVGGKRVGASPAAAGTVYDGADLNTETSLKMNMSEVAWNVKHADSVAFYHYRARKVSRTGVATNWYETNAAHAGSRITPAAWSTGFGSSVANSLNDSHQVVIDLTAAQTVDGGSFIAALRSADKGDDYSNNNHIFNDSARIEIQVRPVYNVNEDLDYLDAGEFGQWSNTLVYVDNIAPCDSDFVGAANCNILAEGGVGVVTVPVVLDRNTGAPGVGNYQITLTFPEDMDTVNKPSVSLKYGVVLGAGETAITSTGTFIDARTYRFNLVLAAGIDYSDNAIYYSISVADMKDASGVTIQSSGDTGTAADGVLETTADDTEDQGSTNIQLLQML